MIETNELNCKSVGAGPVSAHASKVRQNKGITLIALIITIVVMLILVGVTINIAVNGGLFQQAGKAVSDTQNAINAEQALASGEIKIGDSWYNSMDDYLKGIESLKSLQEKPGIKYYSTLAKAVEAVNNGTIDNGDSDKENAVAGVYTENNKTTVVLLKDSIEGKSSPSVDMTINLGGKTLSSIDKVGIDVISGNITIDGRLQGSVLEVSRTDGSNARPIQHRAGTCMINGGTYISNSIGAMASYGIATGGDISIQNALIAVTDKEGVDLQRCSGKAWGNSYYF